MPQNTEKFLGRVEISGNPQHRGECALVSLFCLGQIELEGGDNKQSDLWLLLAGEWQSDPASIKVALQGCKPLDGVTAQEPRLQQ